MSEKWILNLSEFERELTQREPWSIMAEDIADNFKKWELIWELFLDSIMDLIKLWKDMDVIKLVTWYYKHYWEWKSWKVMFKKLVDLWYLDISRWKDHKNFIEPALIEAAMYYLDEYPDKSDIVKEIFHIK